MLTLGEKKAKQAYHVTFFKGWMAGWMVSRAVLHQHAR
jgi:formate/nitrite transporter FocA (FNT family)